jgi:hypothetical protein
MFQSKTWASYFYKKQSKTMIKVWHKIMSCFRDNSLLWRSNVLKKVALIQPPSTSFIWKTSSTQSYLLNLSPFRNSKKDSLLEIKKKTMVKYYSCSKDNLVTLESLMSLKKDRQELTASSLSKIQLFLNRNEWIASTSTANMHARCKRKLIC